VRTLGIDLAAQNENTATCVIEWETASALVAAPVLATKGTDLRWLVELAGAADVVGIDASFGFPEAVVEALPTWADGGRWSGATTDELRFRITDRFVRDLTTLSPLSASSNLIAITAWRCAAFLDLLRDGSMPLCRLGDDSVYEVYPGAALTRWDFERGGYKTRGNAAAHKEQRLARERPVTALTERAPWLDLTLAEEVCIESDDALDSVIAALVARAAATRRTIGPDAADEHEQEVIAREGWIHVPKSVDTFAELVKPT
jgi:hypothetical protein